MEEKEEKIIEESNKEGGIEIKDILYRIEEMKDAMNNSIENINNVVSQQLTLTDIINSSDKKEEFENFIKDMEKQNEQLNVQKNVLIIRKELLSQVIERCKNDIEQSKTVSILAKAIGMFGEE